MQTRQDQVQNILMPSSAFLSDRSGERRSQPELHSDQRVFTFRPATSTQTFWMSLKSRMIRGCEAAPISFQPIRTT